jgi:hypothetical protein
MRWCAFESLDSGVATWRVTEPSTHAETFGKPKRNSAVQCDCEREQEELRQTLRNSDELHLPGVLGNFRVCVQRFFE